MGRRSRALFKRVYEGQRTLQTGPASPNAAGISPDLEKRLLRMEQRLTKSEALED